MFRIIFRIPAGLIDILTEQLFAIGALSVASSEESVSEKKYQGIPLLSKPQWDEEAVHRDSPEISVLSALFENTEPVEKHFADTEYLCEEVKDEDWKYRWMENLTDFEICPGIIISPVTEHVSLQNTEDSSRQDEEAVTVKLDPRDAFGDGKHPTTAMCAGMLADILNNQTCDKSKAAMLDAGTGTGILAVIAYKLGIRDITAFDIDEDSVKMASLNSEMNQCRDINFFRKDIKNFRTHRKYRIITANLLTAVIEENTDILKELLEPGGFLIVSGISDTWDKSMQSFFNSKNLEIINKISCNGWMCYVLTHR